MKLERLLLTYPDFKEIGIPFSRRHINWLMRNKRFPKPIRLGGDDISTKACWRYAEILAWIEERAAASGLPPLPAATQKDESATGTNPAAL